MPTFNVLVEYHESRVERVEATNEKLAERIATQTMLNTRPKLSKYCSAAAQRL